MGTTLIIDCDRYSYAHGFMAQRLNEKTGEIELEPLSHCLATVRGSLNGLLEKFDMKRGDNSYKLFLDGGGNFREDMARIRTYKGNRKGKDKPVYYQEIRDYLVNEWGAILVEGMEADDACAIELTKLGKNGILCGVDKDLLQVAGKHYNIMKGSLSVVTQKQAIYNLWHQAITGDSTDNIPGCKGIGPKKAEKIIARVAQEALGGVWREGELPTHSLGLDAAVEAYRSVYEGVGCETECGTQVLTWREALEENLGLVYLLREEGDSFRSVLGEGEIQL